MNKTYGFLIHIAVLSLALSFSACKPNENQKQIEVTRVIRQTVEVTRVVQNGDIQSAPTVITPTTEKSSDIEEERETNKAEIMVIEYYLLLKHGLYNDAYNLLNPSFTQKPSFDQYSEQMSVIYNNLDILYIEPFTVWAARNRIHEFAMSKDLNYIYVELVAWSKGDKPSEGTSGVEQHMFLKLKREENGWTILSFATNPPVR
jgi:hypothetical protein